MYYAELLNERAKYTAGDDVRLKFIVRDDDGTLITNATLITLGIKCEITDYCNETLLQNAISGGSLEEIAVSGNEILVYIPNSATEDYQAGFFAVELQLEDVSDEDDPKYYTVFSNTIYFKDDILDW